MNLAASVIRCSPRKGDAATRQLGRLIVLITASSAAGWLIHFTRHLT